MTVIVIGFYYICSRGICRMHAFALFGFSTPFHLQQLMQLLQG